MNERLEVRFRGHVQGVGFRFTTARIAAKYPVTGYVRNIPDGCVELVLEGGSDVTRKLVDELKNAMVGYIEAADIVSCEPTGEFVDFGIRR